MMPAPTTARSTSPSGAATSRLASLLLRDAALEQLEVRVHHQADERLEARSRLPAELVPRLRVVADQMLHLGWAQVARVDPNVLLWIQVHLVEGHVHQLAHAVRLPGGDHVVVGLVLLEHQPHGLYVVLRVAPVPFGVEVPERQLLLEAELDGGRRVAHLAGHELEPAALGLVVEKYP